MDDVHHLDVQMRKARVDADDARVRAGNERLRADQYRRSGQDGQMAYHLAAAEKLEAKARELDEQYSQAENDKSNAEARIADLEQQRDALDAQHNQQRNEIEKEIARIRGTTLSL